MRCVAALARTQSARVATGLLRDPRSLGSKGLSGEDLQPLSSGQWNWKGEAGRGNAWAAPCRGCTGSGERTWCRQPLAPAQRAQVRGNVGRLGVPGGVSACVGLRGKWALNEARGPALVAAPRGCWVVKWAARGPGCRAEASPPRWVRGRRISAGERLPREQTGSGTASAHRGERREKLKLS